jgi:hypothetical protein
MRKIYISVLIAIPIYFSFNSSAISKWKSCGGEGERERILDGSQKQIKQQKLRDYQRKSC